MFRRLGEFVVRWPWAFVGAWLALATVAYLAAPSWETVAHDSDFDSLPDDLPSMRGQELLRRAFPEDRSRSSLALVFHRDGKRLTTEDIFVVQDLTASYLEGLGDRALPNDAGATATSEEPSLAFAEGAVAYRDAIEILDGLIDHLADREDQDAWTEEAIARRARSVRKLAALHRLAGNEEALRDVEIDARSLGIDLATTVDLPQAGWAENWQLADVWSPHHPLMGRQLIAPDDRARMVVLQLDRELAATANIDLLDELEVALDELRGRIEERTKPGFEIAYTGTAAIGGETLRSARASVRRTELITVVMVVLFLAVIYRSPTLILAPLITLGVALITSLNLIAIVAAIWSVTLSDVFDYRVYATTRIFVVVILLGAGTDYCLFLIARYRETIRQESTRPRALVAALAGVGEALVASAMTTVLGLGTMLFSEFGKIASSGPTIAVSLLVGLAAALTLTPALLTILGPLAFWNGLPWNLSRARLAAAEDAARLDTGDGPGERFWRRAADAVIRRPALILFLAVAIFLPAFWNGLGQGGKASYDLAGQIDPSRPAREGLAVVDRYFPVGHGSPITVVVERDAADFLSDDGRQRVAELAGRLFGPNVAAVYSLSDPLGQSTSSGNGEDESPQRSGLFSAETWSRWTLRAHRLAEQAYVSGSRPGDRDVTRFQVVLALAPTSNEAVAALTAMESRLDSLKTEKESFWTDAQFAFAGATASIRDLKQVTKGDTLRVQILTVIAVYCVLLALLRRPVVCAYMILSVLWSFFVTLGITDWFFAWRYGETYDGLDWKLPLFLFVILVAVGEDYNVYLAARVEEESRRRGRREGLREAMIRTGGIVTSCGLIMAATFFSMTGADWGPTLVRLFPALEAYFPDLAGGLRSVTEMGFALTLGILIDTLLVRTILLPAFLAIWDGRRDGNSPAVEV